MGIYNRVFASTSDFSAGRANVSTWEDCCTGAGNSSRAQNNASVELGSYAPSTFYNQQTFLEFDTSSVVGTPVSALIALVAGSAGPANGDEIDVRLHEWSTAGTSAYRTRAQVEALTKVGQGSVPTALVAGQRVEFAYSLPEAAAASSSHKVILHSQRQLTGGSAPTGGTTNAPVYNSADASSKPYLDIITGDIWQYVGASSVVEVTATSHTLTEPAGVAEGDLLVACFAIRTTSTTPVTLPSGWTLATQSYINNTTANSTAGAASGLIAYCIRGASAPALTFTHPAAPSVARGQIVAYRNSDPTQASVLDVAASTRLTTAATAISVAGITTTQDDDLIVGVIAGGRNITVTNFNNATGGTSSGTGASITAAPAPNAWQERADAGTATGADTGLSIRDSVFTSAGDTGNFTATASASALHLVMVAAFKIKPAGGPNDAVTPTGFSTGSPTVGSTTLTQNHVRNANGITAGAPVVGSVALSQNHVIGPSGIAAGAPTLGSPSVTEGGVDVAVSPANITAGAPTLGTPSLSQNHAVAPAGVSTGSPTAGIAALTQAHSLAPSELVAGQPTLAAASLQQSHALSPSGVETGAPVVGSPTIAAAGALVPEGIETGAPTIGAPTFTQSHALSPAGLATGSPTVGAAQLSQGHALSPIGLLAGSPVLSAAAISQIHILAIEGISMGGPALGSPGLDVPIEIAAMKTTGFMRNMGGMMNRGTRA